jgi:hypothetical protein
MLEFFNSWEFWAGVTSGSFTLVSALIVYLLGRRYLERREIRRLRVECFVALCSYRTCLTENLSVGVEEQTRFFAALNSAIALFGDSQNVVEALRRFRSDPQTARVLFDILTEMRAVLKLDGVQIHYADLESPFWRSPRKKGM